MKLHLCYIFVYTICILSIIPRFVYSQEVEGDKYNRGYIITDNDTIQCNVIELINYSGKINYYIDNDQEKNKILCKEIKELKSKYIFERINYKNKVYLMKRIISDYVSLYEYSNEYTLPGVYNFKTKNWQVGNFKKQEKDFYLVKNNVITKIGPISKYKRDIKNVLSGYAEINAKIDRFLYDELEYKIEDLVNNYNYLYIKNKTSE